MISVLINWREIRMQGFPFICILLLSRLTLLAPIDPPCLQPAHPRYMRLPWTVPATLDARLTLECLQSLFQAMHAHLDPTSDLQGAARLSRKKVAARHYGKEGSGRLHAAECFLVPTIPTRGIKFCFSPASYPLFVSPLFFGFSMW